MFALRVENSKVSRTLTDHLCQSIIHNFYYIIQRLRNVPANVNIIRIQ